VSADTKHFMENETSSSHKGDLLDQREKYYKSGLGKYFSYRSHVSLTKNLDFVNVGQPNNKEIPYN
jgi:hypothetical protein